MHEKRLKAPLLICGRFPDGKPSLQFKTDGAVAFQLGKRKFWIDGSAIVSGVVIHDGRSLGSVIPANAETWAIERIAEWWSWNAKNPCALYVSDESEGWAACLPDALGGALAFYHKNNKEILISTQLSEIILELKKDNKGPKKSAQFQLERLMFGNGGLIPASYDDIASIEPFEYLIIKNNQIQISHYKIFDTMKGASRHELINILREDIISSITAIANSDTAQKISHLTGGFDSRLILSATLHLNLEQQFLFFCSGPDGSTDRTIADGLSRQFGLVRSTGAGLTNAQTSVMSERLMGALFDSSGMTNTGPQGREIHVPVSAMGGGYGEILRTFYGNRLISSDSVTIDAKLLRQSYLPNHGSTHPYIAKHALVDIEEKLNEKFGQLSSKYDDVAFLGDAFYTHVRNRYHIGQSSLLWSRVGSRFDPLYSVAGYCLASNATQHVRSSNAIGFDLMESFAPELLSFPFDYNRHNEQLSLIRKPKKSTNWPKSSTKLLMKDSLTPSASQTSPFLKILDQLNVEEHQPTRTERQSLVSKANTMGANYWQVAYQAAGQDLLRKAYEQSSDSTFFDYIDSKYVVELFRKTNLNRSELRELYNLGGIIAWLSFG
ncbi:hypothetical protein KRR55_16565 [Paeniglutamicibacter sp. ABSL32-1]|uniref:hypothetical protein n=1 Tax=Paeniglutamicibacter quisquiliarum TaxID=2849498 RepID=UPI001C2DBD18|nr:hypothetical protein [Paeniglutamicibacter quisquiliarum]MBV1780730.1 hypothetical protein [Paeniglutamicibacter quisquiliarum]